MCNISTRWVSSTSAVTHSPVPFFIFPSIRSCQPPSLLLGRGWPQVSMVDAQLKRLRGRGQCSWQAAFTDPSAGQTLRQGFGYCRRVTSEGEPTHARKDTHTHAHAHTHTHTERQARPSMCVCACVCKEYLRSCSPPLARAQQHNRRHTNTNGDKPRRLWAGEASKFDLFFPPVNKCDLLIINSLRRQWKRSERSGPSRFASPSFSSSCFCLFIQPKVWSCALISVHEWAT